jgi:hypothetical protein
MSDRATTVETDDADEPDAADPEPDPDEVDTSHLDGIEDGCGCAEVWEHLSEERED